MPDNQAHDRLRRGLLQEAKLLASDRNSTAYFGATSALSADGNTAIVGAYAADDLTSTMPTTDSGAAYIFTRVGGTWIEEAKLEAADKLEGDQFGGSVAISSDGNTVLIGATAKDDTQAGLSNTGATYVFTRTGTTWMQEAKLEATSRSADDGFGVWVSLSNDGNTALIGASGDDDEDAGVMNRGAAYVFARNMGSWAEQVKLVASDAGADQTFGSAVVLSGDGNTAIVGASSGTDGQGLRSGAAYVFVRNGTTWAEQQKLLASDPGDSDVFSRNLTLSQDGNTAIITAQVHDEETDPATVDSGVAYAFTRNGPMWTQTQRLLSPDRAFNDRFGTGASLSSDGRTLLVGARFDADPREPASVDNGAAYVYKLYNNSWLYQGKLIADDRRDGDWAGYHASLSGDGVTVLVGAFGEDDEAGGLTDNGAAYIYLLGDAIGAECTTDAQCISGFCVDGVCCDSACGGTVDGDCQACRGSLKHSGTDSGLCGAAPMGLVCRGSLGFCDLAETCDGTSTMCPNDAKRQAGTVCRVSGGPCDVAETCDGVADLCPKLDAVKTMGTQCKAPGANNICDPADVCDGRGKLCPARFAAPGLSCGGGKVCKFNGICS
jgi:hypothetical protein